MAYSKTNWANGTPPAINAANLNKIENGIVANETSINNLSTTVNSKVDKAAGKGLSTNDFSNEEKTNLANVKTEVENIRIGANGITYASAGDAVRNQISNLKSALSDVLSDVNDVLYLTSILPYRTSTTYPSGWRAGFYNVSTGAVSDSTSVRYTRTQYLYKYKGYDAITITPPEGLGVYAVVYSKNDAGTDTFVESIKPESGSPLTFTPNPNYFYGYSFGRLPSTDYAPYIEPSYVNTNLKVYAVQSKIDMLDTTKFVATDGNDSNFGDEARPFATLAKAFDSGATRIFVKRGAYTEAIYKKNVKVEIIGYGASFTTSTHAFRFENSDVKISGVSVTIADGAASNISGIFLDRCNAELNDCVVSDAPDMCYLLSGSKVTCTRCIAINAGVDGFNAHDRSATESYPYDSISDGTFIDCEAYGCGDDGLSYHENGKIHVHGGRYHNNASTGIAPHNNCYCEIIGAYIYGNATGIECNNPDTTLLPIAIVSGCILTDNESESVSRGYGLSASYYKVYLNATFTDGNSKGRSYDRGGATIIDSQS